jgi:hypothetical protein
MSESICNFCKKDMMEADGCVENDFVFKNVVYSQIRLGEEKHIALKWQLGDKYEAFMKALIKPVRCPDCACKPGEFHHPGCDQEECPKCGLQAINCQCTDPDGEGPI